MCNILKNIDNVDAFLKSLKEDVTNGSFVPKWNLKTENHRYEIICPTSYDEQIFFIHNIKTGHIFSLSSDIEFLKNTIRDLEAY